MNILITGARGFVGKNLTEALKAIRDGKDRTHPELEIRDICGYDTDNTPEQLADIVILVGDPGLPISAKQRILCSISRA